jgi:hypothetical protein
MTSWLFLLKLYTFIIVAGTAGHYHEPLSQAFCSSLTSASLRRFKVRVTSLHSGMKDRKRS